MGDTWEGPHTFHRTGAWTFYVFMNAMALYFNSCLIISIFRLRERKTSTDVLIGGLASGIIVSVLGCGPQCFANLVSQHFAFGEKACFLEAFFHIVGMIIQFLSVSAIAYRTYVGVVKLEEFGINKALLILISIWCVGFAGTLLFGSFSPIYLVASGTFCFYDWSSLALIAWAWPVAGIAAILMSFWYYKTFQVVAAVRRGAKEILVEGSKRNADLVIKLSTMVFLFIFGYSGLICQSLYEVSVGRAKLWGDVVAAVIVTLYWVGAPVAYAMANHRLGFSSVYKALPGERSSLRSGSERIARTATTTPGARSYPGEIELPSDAGSKLSQYGRGASRVEGSPEECNAEVFPFDPRTSNVMDVSPDLSTPNNLRIHPPGTSGTSSTASTESTPRGRLASAFSFEVPSPHNHLSSISGSGHGMSSGHGTTSVSLGGGGSGAMTPNQDLSPRGMTSKNSDSHSFQSSSLGNSVTGVQMALLPSNNGDEGIHHSPSLSQFGVSHPDGFSSIPTSDPDISGSRQIFNPFTVSNSDPLPPPHQHVHNQPVHSPSSPSQSESPV